MTVVIIVSTCALGRRKTRGLDDQLSLLTRRDLGRIQLAVVSTLLYKFTLPSLPVYFAKGSKIVLKYVGLVGA